MKKIASAVVRKALSRTTEIKKSSSVTNATLLEGVFMESLIGNNITFLGTIAQGHIGSKIVVKGLHVRWGASYKQAAAADLDSTIQVHMYVVKMNLDSKFPSAAWFLNPTNYDPFTFGSAAGSTRLTQTLNTVRKGGPKDGNYKIIWHKTFRQGNTSDSQMTRYRVGKAFIPLNYNLTFMTGDGQPSADLDNIAPHYYFVAYACSEKIVSAPEVIAHTLQYAFNVYYNPTPTPPPWLGGLS